MEKDMNQAADQLLLQSLCRDLDEVENQIAELNAERDQLRAQLSEVVERLGGKVVIQGFGMLQMASPSVVVSYERKGLEQLVQELRAAGNTILAEAIEQNRKESMRTGGLRVVREK
jgi:hypothetical protein